MGDAAELFLRRESALLECTLFCINIMGFPSSSAGKESACNVGDPGSTPMLGRSAGEEIGYPL